ncbi:MAG: stalk domain-containing protein [Fimbriimonadaceae bacterium]|jgi:hypothetical protein|nr:stalk domain-containing protein [Fimbriimonadaceae bacterium]
MKALGKAKLTLMALVAMMAVGAQASMVDASILIDRAANNRTLTVKYDGARASLVELRINGVSVASRRVSDAATTGTTDFSIEPAALETGENRIEIRLFDKAGKLLGIQRSTIVIDRSGTGGPFFLERSATGSNVQGQVEIRLGLRTDVKNIYVSFFVNDEFKALKNFAPFNYVWDTTTVSNGWHEVQAWVVDEANNTFKTERMRLFVNNPGGRTDRVVAKGDTEAQPNVPATAPVNKSAPQPPVAPKSPEASQRGPAVLPAVPTISSNSSAPQPGRAAAAKPSNTSNQSAVAGQRVNTPPAASPAQPVVPASVESVVLITPSTKGVVDAVTNAAQTKAPAVATAQVTKIAPVVTNVAPVKITWGARMADNTPFNILLDGQVVRFDVAPRVEEGIPLTPFRHLIEANGGKVDWFGKDRTVVGNTDGTTIWFQIGNEMAKVNGVDMRLEKAPYILKGRSFVPLSFIGQALKVDVQYDPKTGHVLILSQVVEAGPGRE